MFRATPSRRQFLQTASTAATTAVAAPLFLHASDKAGSKRPVVGEAAYRFECHHGWGELPSHVEWGDTHGVAVDSEGLIYVKHRNRRAQAMDAIVVFDSEGRFVRSFGKEYHGGGHGIDVRKEGGEEFLYLSDIKHGLVAKSTLRGEQVWKKGFPQEPDVYEGGKKRYRPTNVAFAPDGGFYVGDGYGSHYVHQYDAQGEWVRTFGGPGTAKGKLKTPHGLWLDDRPGREPALCVCDRANARLQYFTLDGKPLSLVEEVSFPADVDIRGDVMLVPDLHARITLFDKNNQVITHLGYDPQWTKRVLANGLKLRRDPSQYVPGKFVHPHDACFDAAGNVYVAEWVPQGRLTFLRKLG